MFRSHLASKQVARNWDFSYEYRADTTLMDNPTTFLPVPSVLNASITARLGLGRIPRPESSFGAPVSGYAPHGPVGDPARSVGFVLGSGVAQEAPQGPPPAPVTTAVAEGGAFSKPVNLTGTVEALASTELSSQVDGYLAELLVDEGDAVTEGQVVAQIRALALSLCP